LIGAEKQVVYGDHRDIPSSEFDKMIDINLKASFLLVKGAVDGMKAQKWGRIIFISSIAAYGAGINGCRKISCSKSPAPSAHARELHRLCSLKRGPQFHDDEPLLPLSRI
jgi:NAD(P)-dependent dehydrogenase (short-subunit alcohol dehydrogenase family)